MAQHRKAVRFSEAGYTCAVDTDAKAREACNGEESIYGHFVMTQTSDHIDLLYASVSIYWLSFKACSSTGSRPARMSCRVGLTATSGVAPCRWNGVMPS